MKWAVASKVGAIAAHATDPNVMLKKAVVNLNKHGRRLWEKFSGLAKREPTQQIPRAEPATLTKATNAAASVPKSTLASRFFANNVTPNLAQELRNHFQFRMNAGSFPIFGNYRGLGQRVSMFAFVTLGVTSSSQYAKEINQGTDDFYEDIRVSSLMIQCNSCYHSRVSDLLIHCEVVVIIHSLCLHRREWLASLRRSMHQIHQK